ncbi:MAG: hypothetical protein JSW39_16765 [Desulfobacterales bacterium]|nr:MAG: hypothetical protein JSW39_16765 [Desulfobacterales bacterium]
MVKKFVSMLVVTLFVFSFIAITGVAAEEMQKITGTVMSVNPDAGELMVKDEAGEEKSFTAGAEVDLKTCKEGDKVSVEADADGNIKSLSVIQ